MSDRPDSEQEREWMRCWQECSVEERDPALRARELANRVNVFDRKIFWRNFREYAAGLLVLVWAGYGAYRGSRPAMAMMLGVTFVMAYLWWRHRRIRPLDPSSSVGVYQKELLVRFDDQIRLLSRVKYWYLLPLYVPIVWQFAEGWRRQPWSAAIALAIVTAVFAFIGWLNEKWAVQFLRKARARLLEEQMF